MYSLIQFGADFSISGYLQLGERQKAAKVVAMQTNLPASASTSSFFKFAFALMIVGTILSVGFGMWETTQAGNSVFSAAALHAGFEAGFVTIILAALEVSLSLDNAIINASVLQKMTLLWRKRFLTWGLLIAVFLIRLIFPLVLVSIIANINLWQSLMLAVFEPVRYAALMQNAHLAVATFGGTFLLLVATQFFAHQMREEFWIPLFEVPLKRVGRVPWGYVALTALVVGGFGFQLMPEQRRVFLLAALAALATHLIITTLSLALSKWSGAETEDQAHTSHQAQPASVSSNATAIASASASAALFVYLEVLDASFSFDGVVGAFAITNRLFIITIGLSIGAFFVRSFTLMFVEKQTLTDYAYLETGAFYAIGLLGVLLFSGIFYEISETFTGLSGLCVIGLAWFASHRRNQRIASTGPDLST